MASGKLYHRSTRQIINFCCSAYDCEFVALVQDIGVPLVTVDRQVLRAFPNVAISLDEFIES
jgi:predicted nucleic acid-binding protein